MKAPENRDHPRPVKDYLAHAYDAMLERVKHALEVAGDTAPNLEEAIEHARRKAEELGEVTQEESAQLADYLRRDLQDMGAYVSESSKDFRTWLRMDLQLIEARLLDMLDSIADRTRVELAELAAKADTLGIWHSGEIAGPGVLECTGCGQELHFSDIGRIPPCPHCHGSQFQRPRHRPD